jgi:protein gp37
MGDTTGISWTDSTMNFWEGCTKVGPGCDNCYAADRDIRWHGGSHWGAGAPRRQMSLHTRNNAGRWQRDAAEFLAAHGHPRRVFCSSLADIFDNEVDDAWRADAFAAMEATPDLRWQLCTKRVSNISKMVPKMWRPTYRETDDGPFGYWPANVGVLITVVTPEEVLRDVPRLVDLKRRFGIPWVGLSIEPMIADVADALASLEYLAHVDWIILGGESGPHARPCDIRWMRRAIDVGERHGCAMFVKQMGDKPVDGGEPLKFTGKGADTAEWPEDLRLHEFPKALC